MAINEEYFKLYDDLKNLLLKAYINVYSLEEIKCYNESVKNGGNALIKSSFDVMSHICELLKADLGLTIWKVYLDTNSKANTIRSLCSKLRNISLVQSLNLALPSLGLPSEFRSLESQLSILRKTYLAHNDAVKSHTSIKIAEVIKLLNFLKEKLNTLCFTEVDDRVTVITDATLIDIKFGVSLGLGIMLNRSAFSVLKRT